MKRLLALLCLLPLLAVVQSKQKTAPKGGGITVDRLEPTLKPIPFEVREIGGTNYYVQLLDHWLVNNLTNARPLVGWRELKAKVWQVTADGLLLERTVEPPVYRERPPDALTEIGGSLGRRDNLYLYWRPNGTPQDFGDLFLLVRHPDGDKLVEGEAVRVLAMRVGNYKFTDTKGAERTIAKFDFGKPVTLATNAPSKK